MRPSECAPSLPTDLRPLAAPFATANSPPAAQTMLLPADLGVLDNSHVAAMLEGFVNGYLLDRQSAGRLVVHAREFFHSLPTTNQVAVPEGGRVTVVGDTHGQLPDLLHILQQQGWPSPSNRFVFVETPEMSYESLVPRNIP